MTDKAVTAIKGFDRDLKCRGYQYAPGQTHTHDGEVRVGRSGFHAIPGNPLEVFCYYAPGVSRFYRVDLSGDLARSDDDVEIAGRVIRLAEDEMTIADIVAAAVEWLSKDGACSASATSNWSVVGTTDGRNVISATGNWSVAAATGYHCATSATGDFSVAIVAGDQSAALVAGCHSAAIATGHQSAASATGYQNIAGVTVCEGASSVSGDCSVAVAAGDYSYSCALSTTSCAVASGLRSTVDGVEGAAICAVERDHAGRIVSVASGIVGRDGIRPKVRYRCVGGALVEAMG